jgi:hypothetical protein
MEWPLGYGGKMTYKEFQLLMIFWQLGLVDTFSVLKLCVNCGSQYVGIVLSSAAGNYSDLGIKSLVEPILGFGTSYKFVKSAATSAERHQRIVTLASFFAVSIGTLTTDPTTNAAIGAAVASNIGYMKAILARGGSSHSSQIQQYILTSKDFAIVADSIKTSLLDVHPYRSEFTANSKMIIDNMFNQHTAHRYMEGSIQKIKTIPPTCLIPIASTQISTTSLIGWTFFGSGLVIFVTLSALHVFQRAQIKRYKNKNDEVCRITFLINKQ